MYHPMAAAVASWVVQAPMQFVLAACSMLPIFILGNMHWPNFPMAWFIYAITFWTFEGLAQMLSVSPSVLFGLFNYLNLYFAALLFAGVFVDPEDVIWPLRSLCYFLPLGWSFQSFMFAIFHGQPDYDGTMDCIPGERIPGGAICGQQGFYCSSPNDPTGAACFGRTGDQLLNSLSLRFTILGDEGHYARNISLILSFGVLCRLVYVAQIILLTKVVGSEEPRLPTTVALSTASTVAPARDAPPSATLGAPDLDVAEAQESAGEAVLRGSAGVGAASSCVFAFSNLGYSITPKNPLGVVKGPPKSVLANTSATVTEGEVLAIVGPSGAGKTILLDSLNFFKGPGARPPSRLLPHLPFAVWLTHQNFVAHPSLSQARRQARFLSMAERSRARCTRVLSSTCHVRTPSGPRSRRESTSVSRTSCTSPHSLPVCERRRLTACSSQLA